MRIYYFVHTVGRDTGNSGIPRVSRNLARALQALPGVQLVPVRWDQATSSIVHAERAFCDVMRMHGGPDLNLSGDAGMPVHRDRWAAGDMPWLFVPEVPHLGADDGSFGPTHLAYVAGYARLHGMRTAAIFHDAMPITHFGMENSADPGALAFTIYAMALASFDVVLPVSEASTEALRGVFGRCGLEWKPQQVLQPLLLPEELIGSPRLKFINEDMSRLARRHEFCMWGTIFPHKNQLAVMQAFNRLSERRPDLDLVLHHVGSVHPRCVEPARLFVRRSHGRIRLHGSVDDKGLMALIGRARATLFVSRAEGYGLPLAESLWLGRPCITSNLAPMTEIAGGGGAVLVDPEDVDDIARAIERIATDDTLYADLLAQLRERPLRTWQDYGQEVRAALTRAAPTGERPVYFTPDQKRRENLRIESFLFGASDLATGRELEDQGAIKRTHRMLEYRAMKPAAMQELKPPRFVERPIFYGPYCSVGPGELQFAIEGELKGKCRLLVTSQEGRQVHYDVETDSFAKDFVVSAPEGLDKLEVVFRTTQSLRYLRVDGISLARWHA